MLPFFPIDAFDASFVGVFWVQVLRNLSGYQRQQSPIYGDSALDRAKLPIVARSSCAIRISCYFKSAKYFVEPFHDYPA